MARTVTVTASIAALEVAIEIIVGARSKPRNASERELLVERLRAAAAYLSAMADTGTVEENRWR